MRSGSRAGVVAFVTSTLVAFSAWGQTSPSAAPEAPATPYPSPAPATAESSASPVPAEVAVEPPAPPLPTTATLQFDTTDPGASYDVTIETAAGSMHCATIVHREHPCTLHGIAPGTVQVHVVGSTSFDR